MNNKQIYLDAVAKRCMMELDEMGIPYKHGVSFSVNTRAKSRYGQCCKKNSTYSINIMAELIDPSYLMGLKNTIIHELLHTCDGCMNHGDKWKYWANMVNKTKHYGISRCSSRESKGLPTETATKEYKYVFICEHCGQVIKRQRKPKWYGYVEQIRCGKCGGHIQEVEDEYEILTVKKGV